ncbi:hypothetical protein [Anatilimnocola aggregata]|nr:hypothetical protein [Anatilimnocola aggregata]
MVASSALSAEPAAKVISSHGDANAIELVRGESRALLTTFGGRALEFSRAGKQALWLDDKEQQPEAGKPRPMSAGRFDIGPELTIAPHPQLWSGPWSGKVSGESAAQLISVKDEATGMQLTRDFELKAGGSLLIRQTMTNISSQPREVCHWGRSFSPGGGICLVPLQGQSRFPSKYAMYEDSAIINVRNQDEKIRERDGFLEILGPPRKPKLGFDSYAGWLAYLLPGDVLFVKRFPTFPDRVYSEAAGLTLSVWYPAGARIELEPIGPRERLQPGESAAFTEEWFLLSHPFPAAGEQIDLPKLRQQVLKHLE